MLELVLENNAIDCDLGLLFVQGLVSRFERGERLVLTESCWPRKAVSVKGVEGVRIAAHRGNVGTGKESTSGGVSRCVESCPHLSLVGVSCEACPPNSCPCSLEKPSSICGSCTSEPEIGSWFVKNAVISGCCREETVATTSHTRIHKASSSCRFSSIT